MNNYFENEMTITLSVPLRVEIIDWE